mmetsp:Transcript_49102/g.97561  ORF Transcript_49102/g.97561 Transcript_49102/m.97561 type:complete len:178 (-) Transcript_49102:1869-2402(-)
MEWRTNCGQQKPLWSTLAVRQGLRGAHHGLECLVNAFLCGIDPSVPHLLLVTSLGSSSHNNQADDQPDGQLEQSSSSSEEPGDQPVPHAVQIIPILSDGRSVSHTIRLDTAIATDSEYVASGQLLAVKSRQHCHVKLFHLITGRMLKVFTPPGGEVEYVALSGEWLVVSAVGEKHVT